MFGRIHSKLSHKVKIPRTNTSLFIDEIVLGCLVDKNVNWDDALKVCQYFIQTRRPNLYLRQLPIEIHTKFIEENITLIQSLLDFLIPDRIRSTTQKRFTERFFLKYDEPLIRVRLLDHQQQDYYKFTDISIPSPILSNWNCLQKM